MGAVLGVFLRYWQAVAIVAACLAAFTAWQIDRRAQFNAGRQAERSAAIERARDLIEKRMKDDAEINRLDDAGWCREFGYRLLPDGTCG